MKINKLMSFIMALLLGCNIVVAQDNKNEMIYRPIKMDCELPGDGLKLFAEEWVQVKAHNNGNIIIQGKEYPTDNKFYADHQKKAAIDGHEALIPLLAVDADSVYYLVVFSDSKIDSAKTFLRIIDQTNNKIIKDKKDACRVNTPINLGKLALETTIRVAPDNRLSSWVECSDALKAYNKTYSDSISTHNPQANTTVYEVKEYETVMVDTDSLPTGKLVLSNVVTATRTVTVPDPLSEEEGGVGVIIVIILVLSVVAFAVFFFFKKYKKRSETEPQSGANNKEPEDNVDYKTGYYKLKEQLDRKTNEYNELNQSVRKKIDEKETHCQRRINEVQADAKLSIDKANRAKEEALKKAGEIEQKTVDRFKNKIDTLEAGINERNRKIHQLNESLVNITAELSTMTNDRNAKAREIETLIENQKAFTNEISIINYGGATDSVIQYVATVYKLVELQQEIEKKANALLQIPMSDDYNLLKPIALYSNKINNVDLVRMFGEIDLIVNARMVRKGTYLAQFKNDDNVLSNIRQYFFDNYLSAIISATMVFNESLVAMNRFIEEIPANSVKDFLGYRDTLEGMCRNLGITVEYVKLFEDIGIKKDLRVSEGDYGDYPSGSILSADNCIVYLTGSSRPNEKISVKSQK